MKDIKAGIVGTGNIGSSFAALFTGNGFRTRVVGVSDQELEKFHAKYDDIFKVIKERALITDAQHAVCKSLLSCGTRYDLLADCDIVFECVFEDINIKYDVYKKIEENCANNKALVSSSSAYSPDDLKKGTEKNPEKVVVAHPFNPPHLVLFVELVKSSSTSDTAAQFAYDFLESCGRKVCVMKKTAPGFIANRLQHALVREALYMVDSGMVDPADIDKALKYSFMPRYTSVGLFEHQDFFGMDMLQNLQNYLYPHLSRDTGAGPTVNECVKNGWIGQKTGKGIHEWTPEKIQAFKRDSAEPYWRHFNWNLGS